jgi:hypothetical protein
MSPHLQALILLLARFTPEQTAEALALDVPVVERWSREFTAGQSTAAALAITGRANARPSQRRAIRLIEDLCDQLTRDDAQAVLDRVQAALAGGAA